MAGRRATARGIGLTASQAAIMTVLRRRGPMTRYDLVGETRLSRATMSVAPAVLAAEGRIQDTPYASAARIDGRLRPSGRRGRTGPRGMHTGGRIGWNVAVLDTSVVVVGGRVGALTGFLDPLERSCMRWPRVGVRRI
jgi:hypothetical protein